MKLLTIAVPCYNSQAYMEKCIDSLLVGSESVEIIIVNDGSTDNTAVIADAYGKKYPSIIKVIHQQNAGHGGAVNAGIKGATGLYFKVVDSDDWVDPEAYKRMLRQLQTLKEQNVVIDMVISNYVYEKESASRKTVMQYKNILPEDRLFTWDDIGRFRKGKYLLMHSIMYKTSILHECGLEMPKHTFYVDNVFAYLPLPYVSTMYYFNEDLYRYYIGREDQSVNEQVMIRRIDQQIKVNMLMHRSVDLYALTNVKMQRYMFNYLEIITAVTSILLIRSGTNENLQKKKELWQAIKQNDLKIYRRLRFGVLGIALNLPGKAGRKISEALYKGAQKIYGFN